MKNNFLPPKKQRDTSNTQAWNFTPISKNDKGASAGFVGDKNILKRCHMSRTSTVNNNMKGVVVRKFIRYSSTRRKYTSNRS